MNSKLILIALLAISCVSAKKVKSKEKQKEPKKSDKPEVDLDAHRLDENNYIREDILESLDMKEDEFIKPDRNALIIVGPSASGKTTLAKRLQNDLDTSHVHMLARHTTRLPRPNEVNGTDYLFITRQELLSGLKDGQFVTISELADNIYGISKNALNDCMKASQVENKLCMTEMMVSAMVLDALHMIPELNAVFIFIRPPNITVMEERLRGRGTEDSDEMRHRVHQAKADLSFCEEHNQLVDYCLTNDDLDFTYSRLKQIVKTEFPHIRMHSDVIDEACEICDSYRSDGNSCGDSNVSVDNDNDASGT